MEEQVTGKKFPANSVRICIDRYENHDVAGRMYSRQRKGPEEFFSIADMILKIDSRLDEIGVPQAFQNKRSFQTGRMDPAGSSLAMRSRRCASRQMDLGASEQRMAQQTGKYATLELVIQSRKHTSWQGIVRGKDGSLLGSFESELQLIKMILEQ